MPASAGMRTFTRISVGDTTREARRKLRAAKHNLQKLKDKGAYQTEILLQEQKTRGLVEHCALKPPKVQQIQDWEGEVDREETAKILAKFWKLGKIPSQPVDTIIPEVIDGDYIISKDPAYILGISTYTTCWTSCMAQPRGQYRHGVKLWLAHPACSVAAILSQKTIVFGGIER